MPERTMIDEVREHYAMLVQDAGGTGGWAQDTFNAAIAEAKRQAVLDYMRTKEIPAVRIENPEDIIPFMDHTIVEAKAAAWDEGYEASDHEAQFDGTHGRTDNPYRTTATEVRGV